MTFYPFHKDLQDLADEKNFSSGNFGLWYNKLIPNIGSVGKDDAWKVCDKSGNKDGRTEFYKNVYHAMEKNSDIVALLDKKQHRQMHYIKCMEDQGFHCPSFTGTLKTALITGLGEAHPSEISIVLDHTLGIPYIPASGIKGMVRFSHSKQLLFDKEGNFTEKFVKADKLEETRKKTNIPLFFGGDLEEKDGQLHNIYKGSIIFLDAYPVSVPEIKTDIINPHYSNYYGDKNEPPGDYQDPVPVKFLTVAPETQFVFRFILDAESAIHKDQFLKAVKDALENEGIGAKTAIGYGRFKISEHTPDKLKKSFEEYLEDTLPEEEKQERKINNFVKRVNKIEKTKISKSAASIVDSLFSEWRDSVENAFMKNDHRIAKAFQVKIKKKKSKGDFTKHYQVVCSVIGKQVGDNPEPTTSSQSNKQYNPDPEVIKKLKGIIEQGFYAKKDKKKILRKYKKDYPELCSKIKHLPEKKE